MTPPDSRPGSYIRRPKAVRAIQYLGDNAAELDSFHGETFEHIEHPTSCCAALTLSFPGGDIIVDCGDWVVRDLVGNLTVVRPLDFEKDYELQEAQPA